MPAWWSTDLSGTAPTGAPPVFGESWGPSAKGARSGPPDHSTGTAEQGCQRTLKIGPLGEGHEPLGGGAFLGLAVRLEGEARSRAVWIADDHEDDRGIRRSIGAVPFAVEGAARLEFCETAFQVPFLRAV